LLVTQVKPRNDRSGQGKAALERFEADTFGVMGDVKMTFIGLRAALGEIAGA
jgi:hypothetical protein